MVFVSVRAFSAIRQAVNPLHCSILLLKDPVLKGLNILSQFPLKVARPFATETSLHKYPPVSYRSSESSPTGRSHSLPANLSIPRSCLLVTTSRIFADNHSKRNLHSLPIQAKCSLVPGSRPVAKITASTRRVR